MEQVFEDRVLGVRKLNGRSGVADTVRGKVDLQVFHGERGLGLASVFLIAPQQRADFGQQLVVREGLGKKIVAAAAISREPVLFRGFGREKEHRGVGDAADRVAGLPTGHAGHHDVEKDKVDVGIALYRPDRGGTVLRLGHIIIFAQKEPEHLADIRVVVYNQNMRSCCHVVDHLDDHYITKPQGNNYESHV